MEDVKQTIFVDMDSVLVDFDRGFYILSGQKVENTPTVELWKTIETMGKDKFFYTLPWMSDGKELWSFILNNFVDVKILSSLGRNDKLVEKGKIAWLNKNLPEVRENDIILTPDKHKKQHYSKPGHIIIDDTYSNIEEWTSRGGIGILHKNARDTINKLKKLV